MAAARITDRYKAIHPPKLRQKLAAVDEERPTVPGTQARRLIIWQLHTDDLPTAFDDNSQKHNALLRMMKTRSTLTTTDKNVYRSRTLLTGHLASWSFGATTNRAGKNACYLYHAEHALLSIVRCAALSEADGWLPRQAHCVPAGIYKIPLDTHCSHT